MIQDVLLAHTRDTPEEQVDISAVNLVDENLQKLLVTVGVRQLPEGSQDPKKVDPKLIVPFYDSVFCCLPNRWLKWLHCGVRHGEPEGDKAGLDVELSPVTSGLPPTDQGTRL
ncbi:Sodium-coupled monocarboxylate transporter 1 [Branchiostoma belcheri]|nr:Sodium-coupled monocarboxylate transporter 1 [Branchiostoma belcheri]